MAAEKPQGMLHLYVGDGKGKTTAAVGLAVRALGAGKQVLFCQFLKGQPTGEVEPLQRLGALVLRAKAGDKFVFQMTPAEKAEEAKRHQKLLREAEKVMASGDVALVVLDEAVDAVNCGVITLEALIQAVSKGNPATEIVLTGRNPARKLVEMADYYTHFACVAHPYRQGVAAREGIEY